MTMKQALPPQYLPFITSAEFDLDDGHQFMLMSRVLPDVSFEGSTADSPVINMTFFPLKFFWFWL